ncbi:hypothetical protein NQ317_006354, partial [Molorchus minor]
SLVKYYRIGGNSSYSYNVPLCRFTQTRTKLGWSKLRTLTFFYAEHYHPYLAICVCVFAMIANIIMNIIGKDMASTLINRILTALAVTDMVVMIEYIPFAYYYHLELLGKRDFPYCGAVFMLLILHTISICLTLTWLFGDIYSAIGDVVVLLYSLDDFSIIYYFLLHFIDIRRPYRNAKTG